ncbi:hypothetical protein NUW58_g1563 [Xylaria curta]|uniref:Uncharacterized protein n=1 Tax=Xylaria curta TaxID=42375 RepID=A0ACC1PL08_9PEZI|nr:hypothetical protein NUW58_g1563 [Xylaria curta]
MVTMAEQDANPTATEVANRYATHIKDKTVLVTGASAKSLGAGFVEGIAPHGPRLIIIAGRTPSKVQQVVDDLATAHPGLAVRSLVFDFASFEAVRSAAKELNSWDDVPQIDVLVSSVGVMGLPWSTSPSGHEMQLATNHLGPFLFINLIIGKVLASPAPRIVLISSDAHRLSPIRFGDINFRNGMAYHPFSAYGQSKTANALMALSLADKLGKKHNLVSLSLQPGVSQETGLMTHMTWAGDYPSAQYLDRMLGNKSGWAEHPPLLPTPVVAGPYVYAAFDPQLNDHNGSYIDHYEVGSPWTHILMPWATSSIEAERLWKLSEELVGEQFDY